MDVDDSVERRYSEKDGESEKEKRESERESYNVPALEVVVAHVFSIEKRKVLKHCEFAENEKADFENCTL